MRTHHSMRQHPLSRYLIPLVALSAVAAVLLFLFDRQEQAFLDVSSTECERVDTASSTAAGAVWCWELPESVHSLVQAKTPRRASSFLFLGEQLIPLKFPFGTVPDAEREITGWHLIEQDRLIFQLPAGVQLSELQESMSSGPPATEIVGSAPRELRLEINGPMSGRRQFAWATVVLSCFALSFFHKSAEHWLRRLSVPAAWLWLAGAVVVALAFLGSLYICAIQRLPIAWRSTSLGIAWDRLDAIAPGLLLISACCGWLYDRRRAANPAESEATAEVSKRQMMPSWSVQVAWLAGAALFLISFVRLLCWGVGATHPWSPVEISSPFCSAAAYSDAAGYLAGAYHLLAEGTLDEWNQRRPINATLFAMRLIGSGWNVDLAKWLQAVVVALAAAWAAREVALSYGRYAGIAALALLWGCGRLFLATTLSEPLGFALGSLALVGLLRQIRTGSIASGMLGLGSMTLAQAARPGALFVLPALLLCAGSWGRTWRERTVLLALASLMIAAMMAVSPLLSRLYGTQTNLTGSNFAYTFAGLASGQSWSEVIDQYQEQLDALPNEKAVATFLYQEGFRLIRSQPEVFLGELLKGVVRFTVDLPRFLVGSTSRSNMDVQSPLLIPQVLFLATLALLALWRQWNCGSRHDWGLWSAIFVGCATSIPFVYLDGGMRVLMATWPAALAWLATGLAASKPGDMAPIRYDFGRDTWPLAGLLVAVIGIALAGPALAHRWVGHAASVADGAHPELGPPADMAAAKVIQGQWVQDSGVDGDVDWLQVDWRMRGPGVSVGNLGGAELTVMQWQRELQISGVGSEAYLLSRLPKPPFRFDQVYDLRSGMSKILFLPGDQTEVQTGTMVVEIDGSLGIFGRRLP